MGYNMHPAGRLTLLWHAKCVLCAVTDLVAGLGEEVVHQQPHLFGDLQRLVLGASAVHQQDIHPGLLLMHKHPANV